MGSYGKFGGASGGLVPGCSQRCGRLLLEEWWGTTAARVVKVTAAEGTVSSAAQREDG